MISLGHEQRSAAQRMIDAGIDADEARLESELLLRHVLGIDRAAFLRLKEREMPPDARQRFLPLLERRLAREPLAYIIGKRAFFGMMFEVDRNVLIPRPETEGLVERALALASGGWMGGSPLIADVGTGSGCIAVTLAAKLPGARLLACDVSAAALGVARRNAERYNVATHIRFIAGDLLTLVTNQIDAIISNPPYIPSAEIDTLPPEIARYEPLWALDGGADGLAVIRQLLKQAPRRLKPGGAVLLEIGDGQGDAVRQLALAAFPDARVEVERDLAGLERYVTIRRMAAP